MTDRGQIVMRMVSDLQSEVEKSTTALVLALLRALDVPVDDQGSLILSPSQIALFNQTWDKWTRQHARVLRRVNDDLDELHASVLEYYQQDHDTGESTWVKDFIKSLGFGTMAAGTLGHALAVADGARNVIRQKVLYAMTTGTAADLGKILSDIPSEMNKYYKGHLYDIHSQFERIASGQYADELGLEHAVYAGTVIETTRDFCEDRVNNPYTIDEIRSWNNLQWKGKIPGVDVLIALGGYNCRHYLNYITENLYQVIKNEEI